jgi:RNA polymerase sigma-70 factor (ECF subfamily)
VESTEIDTTLVQRARAGNLEAFRALMRKYRGLVYHIVHYAAADERDREDLGQEIFLKVFQNLDSFEFRSNLATWISRIAHNTCLNHQRRKRTRHEEPLDQLSLERLDTELSNLPLGGETVARRSAPDEHLAKRELAASVRRAPRSLPQQYRTVVVLHYLEGFSLQEISESIGTSVGAVKSHLYRARGLLKDWFLSRYAPEDLCP